MPPATFGILVTFSLYSENLMHNLVTTSVVFQALNEIAESECDPEYEDDEMGGGSLLR